MDLHVLTLRRRNCRSLLSLRLKSRTPLRMRNASQWQGWFLLLSICCLAPPLLANGGFAVTRAGVHLKDQVYYLDAQVDYRFSLAALEALDNGVPLTLTMQVQVRRMGAWIWEPSLIDVTQLYLIRYQPLTELYQVARLPDGMKRSFVTRRAAIDALGEIETLPLISRVRLNRSERYWLRIKVALDIEALPLPLRPVAYLTPAWNLSSGWTQWPFEP